MKLCYFYDIYYLLTNCLKYNYIYIFTNERYLKYEKRIFFIITSSNQLEDDF